MLKIQVVSDLHVEFRERRAQFTNILKPSADILALLGDTCCLADDEDFKVFEAFIRYLLPLFKKIIYIPGNHEYYYNSKAPPGPNNTYAAVNRKMKKLSKISDKLYFLNNSTLELNVGRKKYTIIGSVLWSWIPATERKSITKCMSCFDNIYVKDKKTKALRNITPEETSKLYLKNIAFISRAISEAKKNKSRAVVFTHHKPYLSVKKTQYTSAYESDATKLFKKPVIIWCYGHTHVADDSIQKKIRLYSNPKGYPHQRTRFKPTGIIAV